MFRLNYKICALSPLIISSNSGDPNMVSTLDYIPGNYIRGIIANEYINKKKLNYNNAHKNETFYRWFLKGDILFSNAYITDDNGFQYLPIPLSIQEEKYSENKIVNLMSDQSSEKVTKNIDNGYGGIENNELKVKSVKKILNFHHARDRERGVSKTGIIFNYESIKEGQLFLGSIIGLKDDVDEVKKFIDNKEFFIGRSKNNQYGAAEIKVISVEEYRTENIVNSFPDNVVITLLSDTILYNDFGYSVTDVAELEKIIGFKIKKSFIRNRNEEGFSSVWMLKRPSEVVFKAGSSFLIEVKDKNELNKLFELQMKGIGIRTNEGFGRFDISSIKDRNVSSKKICVPKVGKPINPMPNIFKNVIVEILKENILRKEQLRAIQDVSNFKNYKALPKSLVAKLESAVREGNIGEVLQNIKNRRIAREHLENCRSDKQTLLAFLTDNLEGYKLNISLENLEKEVGYDFKNDSSLKEEARKMYLSTFLLFMRKKIKSGGKE